MPQIEQIKYKGKTVNVGDKVLVTVDTMHNHTGEQFEAIITEIENNDFRGIVLYVDAGKRGTFFDVIDNFKLL